MRHDIAPIAPFSSRAQALIGRLGLRPHPEGGWYREKFRSTSHVIAQDGRPARPALTTIYFLLESGQHSRWHRVSSDEVWVHLEGSAIALWDWSAADASGPARTVLGPVSDGIEHQHAVAAGRWQAATPLSTTPGDFSLAACLVGPGFDFADFTMMDASGDAAMAIRRDHPDLARFI